MKILVTGANGYLGRGIVKQLLDDGMQVIATDMRIDSVDERADAIESDLFAIENPFQYFKQPEVVLHLAWRDGFIHNSDAHINDLPKHVYFLESLAQEGVKMISVMGSMHEVGFHEGSINENTVCHPMSYYGIAKDALRNATKLICRQNNILFQWLRGFYIVGNSPCGSSVFSKIVQADLENKKEFPFTLGQNQFDFIDYDKFCLQVASAVEQQEIVDIINICEGKPEKLADRVERFIEENGLKIKLQYGAFQDRPYDSKAVWGDSGRITMIMNNREKALLGGNHE